MKCRKNGNLVAAKNPSKPGKAESPFFGEKSGTQLLASFSLMGGIFLGSTPLRRHFGNLSDTAVKPTP